MEQIWIKKHDDPMRGEGRVFVIYINVRVKVLGVCKHGYVGIVVLLKSSRNNVKYSR